MIKHIVLYFLKNNTSSNREAIQQKLLSMQGNIPCLKSIEVGVDFLQSERSCHISLCCTFADRKGLEEYAMHPVHIPVKEFLKEYVDKSFSVDYEI